MKKELDLILFQRGYLIKLEIENVPDRLFNRKLDVLKIIRSCDDNIDKDRCYTASSAFRFPCFNIVKGIKSYDQVGRCATGYIAAELD